MQKTKKTAPATDDQPITQLKPLKLNLDPKKVRLKTLKMLSGKGFDVDRFSEWLVAHSNYTAADVDELSLEELSDVSRQIAEKLKATAVPKAKSPN